MLINLYPDNILYIQFKINILDIVISKYRVLIRAQTCKKILLVTGRYDNKRQERGYMPFTQLLIVLEK